MQSVRLKIHSKVSFQLTWGNTRTIPKLTSWVRGTNPSTLDLEEGAAHERGREGESDPPHGGRVQCPVQESAHEPGVVHAFQHLDKDVS